jgi:hypothetical protein
MKMIVVVKEKADYKKWMNGMMKQTFKDKYFPVVEAAVAPMGAVVDTLAVAKPM